MSRWNPTNKIAAIALIISLFACIAAWIAIPRISNAIGLDDSPQNRCADYGIKIVSPRDGEEVQEVFQVSGTYINKPPQEYILTYTTTTGKNQFWPQYEVQLNESKQSWVGQCDLRGEPPREAYCAVVVVGDAGRAMFDYYWKVGNEQDVWVPFDKVTDDTEVCDIVYVKRTK